MSLVIDPYRFAVAGGGFTDPTDLPNLAAWYDASDTATIAHTSNNVTQWNDKSGNANHLTPVSSDFGVTNTRTKNGLNTIEFPGVANPRLTSAASIQDATQTWYVVAETDSFASRCPVSLGAYGNATLGFYPYLNSAGNRFRMGQGASEIGTHSSTPTTPTMLLWHMKFTGGASAAFQVFGDGTEYNASGTVGSFTPASTDRIVVAGLNRPTSTFIWDGSICEIIMYTDLHDDTDRDTVMDYLAAKWGTT